MSLFTEILKIECHLWENNLMKKHHWALLILYRIYVELYTSVFLYQAAYLEYVLGL